MVSIYFQHRESEEKCFEKLKNDLLIYEKNLKITNNVKDDTGFEKLEYPYTPKIHRDFVPTSCYDSTRPLRYILSLNYENPDSMVYTVEPKSATIYYPNDTMAEFNTNITAIIFDKLTFNKTASDNNLEIVMHNVSKGTTPTLDLTLNNNSKGYLEIEYLTFKYNDLLCTKNLKDSPLVLPPNASKDYSMTINCKEVADRINGILSNTFTKSFTDSFIGHYGLTAQYSGKVLDFSYETHLTDVLVK